ncbi:unnamed protein product [Rangifer tarandus platyrhynchus]|uniref:Uncharacterized protein n=2 Tax=Rangifer tarandus platyrhynchus TaxID=3082113 RepID=A0AC59YXL8_RANTA|nr:unnamed protein product [Rangifer tarandus platyrhynchus]
MRSSAGVSPSHHTLNQRCTKDVCTKYTFANLIDEDGISPFQVCSFCLLLSVMIFPIIQQLAIGTAFHFCGLAVHVVLSFAHSVSPPGNTLQLGSFLNIGF